MPLSWSLAAGAAAFYLALVGAGKKHPVKVLPALLLAFSAWPVSPLGAVGLLFCAAGDGLLLDKDRRFLHGLGAFLVGHLFLVAALSRQPPFVGLPVVAGLGVVLLAVVGLVLRVLWSRLEGVLRVAVPVYALVLASMVLAASTHSTMALVGALVFVVSDAVLALNHFARRLPAAEMVVMVTYYSAILAIAAALLA